MYVGQISFKNDSTKIELYNDKTFLLMTSGHKRKDKSLIYR